MKKIILWLDKNLEEYMMMFLFAAMACLMGIQVIMRYMFNNSLVWSEELTRYCFIWAAFLSISLCIKRKISIKIDQLYNIMPVSIQRVMRLFTKIVMLIFFIYMLRYSFLVVNSTYLSQQRSPAVGIPMYLVQSSTIVGFSLAGIRIIQRIIKEFALQGYGEK